MREVKKAIEKKGTKEEAFEEIPGSDPATKAVRKPFQSRFSRFLPLAVLASCSG